MPHPLTLASALAYLSETRPWSIAEDASAGWHGSDCIVTIGYNDGRGPIHYTAFIAVDSAGNLYEAENIGGKLALRA